MSISLPKLPYAVDALAPAISGEALNYHYAHHHAGYVKTVNRLARGEYRDLGLEQLMTRAPGPLANAAAQAWNHTFFWHSMAPDPGRPDRALRLAIGRTFGSEAALETAFTARALELFGSGWVWLVANRGTKLEVIATPNAGLALHDEAWWPLLVCDVWEHAYYIDYRGDRKAYVKAFWQVANWDGASRRFAACRAAGKRRGKPIRGVRWKLQAVQAVRGRGSTTPR